MTAKNDIGKRLAPTEQDVKLQVYKCQGCDSHLEFNAIEGYYVIMECSECGAYHYADFRNEREFSHKITNDE